MQRPLSGPAPKLTAPPGACDTHMHFYGSQYPRHPGGPVPAPDATVAEYRQIMKWLGISRVVVVQPNAYGDDNRCILDAVAELGQETARAIVVVKPTIAEAELQRLHAAGARGVRIMCLPGGHSKWDALDETVARIAPLGWHPIIQFDGREFEQREAQLRTIKGNYIIDHTGKFLEPVAPDSAPMKAFLRLLDRGNCYVKLSGPYETSKTGAPDYADVGQISKALVKAAPERMLWASNWPHPGLPAEKYPSDVAMLDRLLDIMPDEKVQRMTLVDNPARLYGW